MRTRRVLIFSLVFGLLAGCAPLTPKVVIEKDVRLKDNRALIQTFQRYWAYRIKENIDEAFAMEAPYVQEMVSLGRYRNYLRLYGKARLKAVHIYKVEPESEQYLCLDCRGFYELKGEKKETRDFRDCWVRVNGKWYHVLKNPLIFPSLGG